MALRGSWIKGWAGDFENLKIVFDDDSQVRQPKRKLGEVPEGWQPPSEEEIEAAMRRSWTRFSSIQDRAKQDGRDGQGEEDA